MRKTCFQINIYYSVYWTVTNEWIKHESSTPEFLKHLLEKEKCFFLGPSSWRNWSDLTMIKLHITVSLPKEKCLPECPPSNSYSSNRVSSTPRFKVSLFKLTWRIRAAKKENAVRPNKTRPKHFQSIFRRRNFRHVLVTAAIDIFLPCFVDYPDYH